METISRRFFAIVPAAGRSTRMKRPKLLLPWTRATRAGASRKARIIDSVLEAWTCSRVDATTVVVRRDDSELSQACEAWPVHLVLPARDPADMKASIVVALEYIDKEFRPTNRDYVLIAPADLPTLRHELIDGLIGSTTASSAPVILPCFKGKQGHPAVLSWETIRRIRELGPDEGLDRLIEHSNAHTVEFPAHWNSQDIDTPDEYQRATNMQGNEATNDPS